MCLRYRTAGRFGVRRRVFSAFACDSMSCPELLFSFTLSPFLAYKIGVVPAICLICLGRGLYLLSKCGDTLSSTTLGECSCHPTMDI